MAKARDTFLKQLDLRCELFSKDAALSLVRKELDGEFWKTV